MPLNDDPDALDDDSYWAVVSQGAQPCPSAIPAHVVADALARLDDQADYVNGEQ
jgi:hypothetical protein